MTHLPDDTDTHAQPAAADVYDTTQQSLPPTQQPASGGGREQPRFRIADHQPEEQLEEVDKTEVAAEARDAGVVPTDEPVEIPAEVRNVLSHSGPSAPVAVVLKETAHGPELPLSDEQIVEGEHASPLSSIRWLATACVRRLKQAHLHLQKIGGKIVRVSDR